MGGRLVSGLKLCHRPRGFSPVWMITGTISTHAPAPPSLGTLCERVWHSALKITGPSWCLRINAFGVLLICWLQLCALRSESQPVKITHLAAYNPEDSFRAAVLPRPFLASQPAHDPLTWNHPIKALKERLSYSAPFPSTFLYAMENSEKLSYTGSTGEDLSKEISIEVDADDHQALFEKRTMFELFSFKLWLGNSDRFPLFAGDTSTGASSPSWHSSILSPSSIG